jgi:hypothetical protein
VIKLGCSLLYSSIKTCPFYQPELLKCRICIYITCAIYIAYLKYSIDTNLDPKLTQHFLQHAHRTHARISRSWHMHARADTNWHARTGMHACCCCCGHCCCCCCCCCCVHEPAYTNRYACCCFDSSCSCMRAWVAACVVDTMYQLIYTSAQRVISCQKLNSWDFSAWGNKCNNGR